MSSIERISGDLPKMVNYRQSPHAPFAHLCERGVNVIVWLARIDVTGHHFADRQVSREAI